MENKPLLTFFRMGWRRSVAMDLSLEFLSPALGQAPQRKRHGA